MHVAQLISTDFPPEEGIGYYTYNLSQQLLERGHRVTVITRGSSLRRERFTHDGIEVLKLPCPPVYPFHVDLHGRFVARALSQLEPTLDLVHLHSPLSPPVDTSLPVVATIHTSVIEDTKQMQDGNVGELYSKLLARVSSRRIIADQCRTADRVTTVAHSVADELAEYYGVDDALVLGNAVNLDEFDAHAPESDDPFVLYVGRIAYRKGVPDFLTAAQQVARTHDVGFKLVGQGPLEEKMHRKARELGVDDRTEFLGHVERDRLLRLFGEATVFVLPSHYEGLPTTLLEAMAAQAPVVATDVSGVPDVIDDGENGLLVPPREPARLADAVTRLLDDPETRDRLSAAARETVEREYTWDSITTEFESLYRTLTESASESVALDR